MVPLSEDSTALDVALRHVYPVRPPKATDALHYAIILAEFARKYQVEALDIFITGYLTDSVERDPVGVYAIAVTYEYHDMGAIAARSCLNLPFSGLESSYLRCITAEHISELHRYHVACGEAAAAVASSDRTWFLLLKKNGTIAKIIASRRGCHSCTISDFMAQTSVCDSDGDSDGDDDATRTGPRCLWNYLYRSASVLARHPANADITTDAFVLKSNNCHACAESVRGDMIEISLVLGRKIKHAIEQVSLIILPTIDVQ